MWQQAGSSQFRLEARRKGSEFSMTAQGAKQGGIHSLHMRVKTLNIKYFARHFFPYFHPFMFKKKFFLLN